MRLKQLDPSVATAFSNRSSITVVTPLEITFVIKYRKVILIKGFLKPNQ